ncbi:TolC family protein [Flavihumibacter profundi]|uniref:TolC family protein n=1 Tax=Flavihumibacter profundi TaxID=2716883 RepID=UPI001CC56C7F|nr:TolC family protein [Flavihumibacter profundi]MBZ5858451.1 TolC family protein [Flavihumibacter profundi]
MRRILLLLTVPLCLLQSRSTAQSSPDTIRLSIPEAEKLFLQNNLSLLAAKYNIDANKVLIQQAKLWDNPTLITDQNIYDGKFFRHYGDYGQIFIQVQQLIRTAGKRSKLAKLAEDNTAISQEQFEDLLRSLRYTLRADMLDIWQLEKVIRVYTNEINEVSKLVKGMDEVYKAGNISLKDNMRLKALLFSLQNELVNIQTQMFPIQSEVKLLLQSKDSGFIQPNFTYELPVLINSSLPPIDTLIAQAMENRPDGRLAKKALEFQQHNLTYQKALAKPDVTVGPEYDQHSSYVPNYVGLTVSLPLNIFNRNQGNIKSAEYGIKSQQSQVDQETDRIRNEVLSSYSKVKYLQGINNREQLVFATDYEKLFQNMVKSYQDKQINLLEFTDFLDAYKDTRLKIVDQHINLVKSFAELNYVVNNTIIPIQ